MPKHQLVRHATALHASTLSAGLMHHGEGTNPGSGRGKHPLRPRRSFHGGELKGPDLQMKLDRETGVVSVQKRLQEGNAGGRDSEEGVLEKTNNGAARERSPSSPNPSVSSAPGAGSDKQKKKRKSLLSGMRATLAHRMLRLASKARTKIMVDGLDKSLAVSSTIVAVRMRPPNTKETALDARSVFSTTAQPVLESNTVCRVGKRAFTYDVVIGPRTSQADVFKMTAKAVLNKVLAGFNGTVMAYGQTGSGKTYTMQGSTEQPGIIPRICANIFLAVQEDKTTEYNVKCSYVEIYNEMLHDLLTKEHTSPFIVEDPVRVSAFCNWPCYANKGLGALCALKLRYSVS